MNTVSRALFPAAPGTERVLQIGEGRFLRAFAGSMIDRVNRQLGLDWGICVMQPRRGHNIDRLNEQQGLYTLWRRGVEGAETVDELSTVTSVTRGLSPYRDFDALLALAASPELRLIISNTTEAGIVYRAEDRLEDCPPESYPGKLTRLLWERYRALGGEGGALAVLPCELIEDNGGRLRRCVLDHARDWGLEPGFALWLDREVLFADTLVDQIVTGYPSPEEAEAAFVRLGYRDALLTAAEPFALWVIAADGDHPCLRPLREAGCPVTFTEDIAAYRARKVALLNGPHTAMTAVGLSVGLETVGQCMDHELLGPYIRELLSCEIMPALALEGEGAFAAAVLDRFRNPYNRHELSAIAMNSVSKFVTRLLPALEGCLQRGIAPRRILLALACLMRLLGDEGCTVSEDPALRALLVQREGEADGAYVRRILGERALWGRSLLELGVEQELTAIYARTGSPRAVEEVLRG